MNRISIVSIATLALLLLATPAAAQTASEHGGQAMVAEATLEVAAPELAVARGPAAPADAAAPAGAAAPADAVAPADTVSDERPLVWASVSLIPPLSVGGFEARHHFALNLVAGAGSALDGVEIGGAVNVRTRDVRGLQVAGAANWASGDVLGLQVAGAANVAGGDVLGFQIGGAASVTGGSMRGIQVAGAANVAGDDVRGAQLGGAGNWAGGDVSGFQIAGAASVAHDVRGAQISGAINVGGELEGMQLSVLNIAGKVTGMQLGVVNIARSVRGVQLGVINVADQVDGGSIGLLSAVRNGHRAAEAWTSDLVPLLVGVKLGSRHVYSLFAAGATPEVGHLGVGLGVHAPLGRMYVDVDATAYELQRFDRATSSTDLLAQGRVMLGIPILPHVSIFGGAAINAAFAFDGMDDGMDEDVSRLGGRVYRGDDVVLRLSPGLFAGVSLH